MTALDTVGRASALPLSLIAQAIPKLSRHDLEALTERLIDRLDEVDGDADLEDEVAEDDNEDCEASELEGLTEAATFTSHYIA